MMDPVYHPPPNYANFEHQQWPDDAKPIYSADNHLYNTDRGADGQGLASRTSIGCAPEANNNRPSMFKSEDDFATTGAMWHERTHEQHDQIRQYSHAQMPMVTSHAPPPPNFTTSYHHPQHWPGSQSGSSTPTPYDGMNPYAQHSGYAAATQSLAGQSQEPISAVSMSPQSSQGGWASNNSSDGTDQRGMIQSPIYRPCSPTTVVRADGIRKKNARFEIPRERNLANIDAMILASTDESEKKELKQQKRLLRNRQAALDSRQRKKTHTEKLEQEKKIHEKKVFDLEDSLGRLGDQLTMEREQWMQQRQQLEHLIHTLQYDRDEAIRTKTVETGELRRQVNVLKDCVKDLERGQARGYAPASEQLHTFAGDFNDFGLDDSWETEFSLINGDGFGMEDPEQMQRQATPRPTTSTSQVSVSKPDVGFSWDTFYMCLLFGAFIAANGNSSPASTGTTSAIASSISPSEAGNVLKAVLNSGSEAGSIIPTMSQSSGPTSLEPLVQASAMQLGHGLSTGSTLDSMHQTLSTPSRRQELAAAFSLSASSYNHITDPFNEHLNDHIDDAHLEPQKPSQLQQAFATMQAEKDEMDRVTGLGAKARERSLLWDQVPPHVVKDFEELVRRSGGMAGNSNGDKMEH